MSTLTASQIAAQAAMHQVQSGQHARKRSLTIPEPINTAGTIAGRQKLGSPPPVQLPHPLSAGHAGLEYHNGTLGGRRLAATTAANVAFPRSPLLSPASPQPERMSAPAPEKEVKGKEKSKMKLFHKPKSIGVSKEKDIDRKLCQCFHDKSGGSYHVKCFVTILHRKCVDFNVGTIRQDSHARERKAQASFLDETKEQAQRQLRSPQSPFVFSIQQF
ncbi:hypothetical protein B0A49_03577 [Cryomyces minteri]|uniref:Uncharacterized protein n=1 Tax=Cryomyces minteri TaxID=331657 RepID=A0A4U0XPW6_9PEZI|nr:hypothetical protein B0A49_03577 [Cryomyces minteri]